MRQPPFRHSNTSTSSNNLITLKAAANRKNALPTVPLDYSQVNYEEVTKIIGKYISPNELTSSINPVGETSDVIFKSSGYHLLNKANA